MIRTSATHPIGQGRRPADEARALGTVEQFRDRPLRKPEGTDDLPDVQVPVRPAGGLDGEQEQVLPRRETATPGDAVAEGMKAP